MPEVAQSGTKGPEPNFRAGNVVKDQSLSRDAFNSAALIKLLL